MTLRLLRVSYSLEETCSTWRIGWNHKSHNSMAFISLSSVSAVLAAYVGRDFMVDLYIILGWLHAQCEGQHAAVEHASSTGKFQMQNPPRVHQLNKLLTPLCLDCTNLGLRFNQSELRLHSVSKQEVKLCKSYDQFEYLVGHWHLYLKFRTVLPLRLTHPYPVARGNHHPAQNDTAHCQSDLQKLENIWLLSVYTYIHISSAWECCARNKTHLQCPLNHAHVHMYYLCTSIKRKYIIPL